MTPSEFMRRQARRRRAGKIIPPCVAPTSFETFPITTRYGIPGPLSQWSLGHHTGEDHACPDGSLATAVSWGSVVCVATWLGPGSITSAGPVRHWGDSYGTHVIIRTATGRFDYAYCHLSRSLVKPGDHVRPGQVIGRTGATGNASGPHLHLEARPAGGRFGTDLNPIHVKRQEPS